MKDPEPVCVADVVPERDGRRDLGPEVGQEPFDRLALAARRPRTEIDDEASSVVRELVRWEIAVDGRDRGLAGGPCRDTIIRLADVERDGGAFALDEQPRGPAEDLGHAGGEGLGRLMRGFVAGSKRGVEAAGVRAAPKGARLETVVAEVRDPADADACRHVGRGPSGQDRHDDPFRAVRGNPRQPSERAPSEREDRRSTWVARSFRERAVEVGDDEETSGMTGDVSNRSERPVGGQGVMSTADVIKLEPADAEGRDEAANDGAGDAPNDGVAEGNDGDGEARGADVGATDD